jgi:hypothetical protein
MDFPFHIAKLGLSGAAQIWKILVKRQVDRTSGAFRCQEYLAWFKHLLNLPHSTIQFNGRKKEGFLASLGMTER